MESILSLLRPSPHTQLGPLERQLLSVLWRRGNATVRELLDEGETKLAYTTVMTTLDRLHKKQLLNRTVEGHAKDGELTALQKAFIDHFAFQCGYCTAGFLNEGQVLLERLARTPIARPALERTIAEALDGHLCRCTGYIKYHEAVRDVILADPARYLRSS